MNYFVGFRVFLFLCSLIYSVLFCLVFNFVEVLVINFVLNFCVGGLLLFIRFKGFLVVSMLLVLLKICDSLVKIIR